MARVLVIDDDLDLLGTLRDMLSRAGHEVFVADSAPGALREYRRHSADVVVTDLFIPDVDGLALIRELSSEVKVIAISGQADLLEDAEAFGAWRTLNKPFSRNDLLTLIEGVAGHSVRTPLKSQEPGR